MCCHEIWWSLRDTWTTFFFPLHLYFSRPNCPNLCFKALKIWPSLSNNKTTMSNWNNVTSKPVENQEEPWMESDLLTGLQENLSPCLQSQQPTDRWHCDAWSLNRKDRVSPENQRSSGVFSLQQSHLIILLVVTTDNSNALHMHDADDLRALQCLTHWCGSKGLLHMCGRYFDVPSMGFDLFVSCNKWLLEQIQPLRWFPSRVQQSGWTKRVDYCAEKYKKPAGSRTGTLEIPAWICVLTLNRAGSLCRLLQSYMGENMKLKVVIQQVKSIYQRCICLYPASELF